MELIGRGDDDRFHLRIREHVGKVGVGLLRLVNGSHALDQVRCLVAERVQARIASLDARLKVGELSNGAAAQHADRKELIILVHALGKMAYASISTTRCGFSSAAITIKVEAGKIAPNTSW